MIQKFALLLIVGIAVSAAARLRFGNAQMHPAAVVGLGNATALQRETIVVGNYDEPMPLSSYRELPYGLFYFNSPLSLYFYDAWNPDQPRRFGQPLHVTFDQSDQSYTVVGIHSSADEVYTPVDRVLFVVEEKPRRSVPPGKALLKLVNAVAASLDSSISIEVFSDNYTSVKVPFASSSDFIEFDSADEVTLRVRFPTRTRDFTVRLSLDATTLFYMRGDYGPTAGYHGSASVVPYTPVTTPISPPLATPVTPPTVCDEGYVESSGVCNCYSGYQDSEVNTYLRCSVPPPEYCEWFTNNSTLNSAPLPTLSHVRVSAGKLAFTLTASLTHEQRTLIELPDPQCSYIYAPSYYTKYVADCADHIAAQIPFAHCGFNKSSSEDEDVYRGVVVVKQITRVAVGEGSMDRVIETPFTFLVRVPTNIAVQSTVEIIAPPPFVVPLTAVLVGQRIDALTRSAVLQYATSLPAPLFIRSADLIAVPYDLAASLHLSALNCTGQSSCVQLLQVHLSNITSCYISGLYAMQLTVACMSARDCPAALGNNTAQATLQSSIVAQNLCSDASVDIGLHGTLRAYSDAAFTAQALSFAHGESAYFAIQTSSSEATISQVTVTAVYYVGPNVPGHYLLANSSVSELAAANNFQTGASTATQAWFSLDISVSTPNSAVPTLFKLNNGQRGVYNFVVFVDVEWQFPDATTNMKRIVLQSSVAQNTRYTAQVEIAPTQDEAAGETSNASSLLAVCLFAQSVIALLL